MHRAFRGHASHVVCCRFLCDDRTVVTAGGHDRAVFQWRTCGIAAEDAEKDAAILAAVDAELEELAQSQTSKVGLGSRVVGVKTVGFRVWGHSRGKGSGPGLRNF